MLIRRGDIYKVVGPRDTVGSEQKAYYRPAIVVSNDLNNRHSSVVEVVYLTSRKKRRLPTHIKIRSSAIPSIALCEQVDSISEDRLRAYVGHCTKEEMDAIDCGLLISLGLSASEVKQEVRAEERTVVVLPFVNSSAKGGAAE